MRLLESADDPVQRVMAMASMFGDEGLQYAPTWDEVIVGCFRGSVVALVGGLAGAGAAQVVLNWKRVKAWLDTWRPGMR